MNDKVENPAAVPAPPAPPTISERGDTAVLEMDRRALIGHLLKIGASSLVAAMGGAAMATLATAEASAAEKARSTAGGAAPVKRKFRYGMVIDTRRCVGCKACVVACKAENKTPPGVSYTVVLDGVLGNASDDKPLFMTKPCFHCENPPCVDVCPVGATFKRDRDGIVVVDYDRCIGCRYCITGCPYGARYFDYGDNYRQISEGTPYANVPSPEYNQFHARKKGESPVGNVRKCTFCLHLQDEQGRYDKKAGRWPSCAKTCTGHAIHFGDFNDPESEVSRLLRERQAIRLKEELGTNPNVYYLL
jgi:molybdopterin-containing oxidoreductase family iron-sulfur binding subunit